MPIRRPLVLNRSNGQIEEIPTGDDVDPAVVLAPQILRLATDVGTNQTTAVEVGLAVPVAVNEWVTFRYLLAVDAVAATTGVQLGLRGPAGGALTARLSSPTGAATEMIAHTNAYDTFVAATASIGTTRGLAIIDGHFRGSTAGTIRPIVKSEVALSQVNVRAGSSVQWQ